MMDWLMAREATNRGTNKCYLYGMGTDLTDDQVSTIVLTHAKIGGTMCLLAYRQPCTKEFVSQHEWDTILRTEQEDEVSP